MLGNALEVMAFAALAALAVTGLTFAVVEALEVWDRRPRG